MNKICVYILLILISADITELHQLFKIPVLLNHFAEHQQRDNRVDMLDFLSMHYWGEDIDDDDDEQDMSLPFKKMDVHPVQVFFLPTSRILHVKSAYRAVRIEYVEYQHLYFPDPALSSLFRPPCA